MRVKICGITNIIDANIAVNSGADALGFIFYKNSKRYISPADVKNITGELPPFVETVGVFVDTPVDEINEIIHFCNLTTIQLHGNYNQKDIASVNAKVVFAIRVKDIDSLSVINSFDNVTYLLDAFHDTEMGGTGLTFDWNIIPKDKFGKIILAGGVSSNNIEEIFLKYKPVAVDLSSSVEISPGVKDHQKMKTFFEKLNKLRYKLC